MGDNRLHGKGANQNKYGNCLDHEEIFKKKVDTAVPMAMLKKIYNIWA